MEKERVKRYEKTGTDETIVSQLKNDGTPEFILDGKYYTLPLEASRLLEAGWNLETETYQAEDVSLQPGERISGEFTKEDEKLEAWIVKTGQLYCIANQKLNEEGIVEEALELKEGDKIRVWGYASQYLEVTEDQKLVVVQPGIVEKNGERIILDENLKGE